MRNLLTAATALTALVFAPQASATLMISGNINGTIFSCADQAACDTNPAVGQLSIADQTIGGVQFLGSAQTQVIGPVNSLNTTSFQVINNTATNATVQLAVSGTSFLGPVAAFNASGSGTFQSAIGSSVTETFFADTANTQGATTPTNLPGTMLASLSKTALLATDSFSQNFAGAFVDPNLYSMSEGTSGILTPGGSLVGRSQTIVTAQVPAAEPAGIAILGIGLLGLGFVISRGKRSGNMEYA
jgi:hypothetical protein